METVRLMRITDLILRRKLHHLYNELEHRHIEDKSLGSLGQLSFAATIVGKPYTVVQPSPPDWLEIQLALELVLCAHMLRETPVSARDSLRSTLANFFGQPALIEDMRSCLDIERNELEKKTCNQWQGLPIPPDDMDAKRAGLCKTFYLFCRICHHGASLRPKLDRVAAWRVMMGIGFSFWSRGRLCELELLSSRESDLSLEEPSGTKGWFSLPDLCLTWRKLYDAEVAYLEAHKDSPRPY